MIKKLLAIAVDGNGRRKATTREGNGRKSKKVYGDEIKM